MCDVIRNMGVLCREYVEKMGKFIIVNSIQTIQDAMSWWPIELLYRSNQEVIQSIIAATITYGMVYAEGDTNRRLNRT